MCWNFVRCLSSMSVVFSTTCWHVGGVESSLRHLRAERQFPLFVHTTACRRRGSADGGAAVCPILQSALVYLLHCARYHKQSLWSFVASRRWDWPVLLLMVVKSTRFTRTRMLVTWKSTSSLGNHCGNIVLHPLVSIWAYTLHTSDEYNVTYGW